jgi:hypothetical protein
MDTDKDRKREFSPRIDTNEHEWGRAEINCGLQSVEAQQVPQLSAIPSKDF